MSYPTTRANAALGIAANQFAVARAANPNADPNDVIDNLNAVPDVIKSFLKKKVGVANLQNQSQPAVSQGNNPLMGQQNIYQQLTERLTRPFRPQMSAGSPVGGVQLPPAKALQYLHQDPDFQSLPKEYQDYAIGVVGGQDALTLHNNTLAQMHKEAMNQESLQEAQAKDQIGFANSPTTMVQKNFESGKWFVDSLKNQVMKNQDDPSGSGMKQIVPLTPWELNHAVNEAPKLGYGDMTRYLNPQQQAGLQALRANPSANVADIVGKISGSGGIPSQSQQAASIPNQIPEATRGEIPSQIANLQNLSPERIATMKMLGYQLPSGEQGIAASNPSLSGTPSPDDYSGAPSPAEFKNAQVLAAIGASQRKGNQIGYKPLLPEGYAAGQAGVTDNSWSKNVSTNFWNGVVPYVGMAGQNALSGIQKVGNTISNYIAGLTNNPPVRDNNVIPPIGFDAMKQKTDQLPDWLANHIPASPNEEQGAASAYSY